MLYIFPRLFMVQRYIFPRIYSPCLRIFPQILCIQYKTKVASIHPLILLFVVNHIANGLR